MKIKVFEGTILNLSLRNSNQTKVANFTVCIQNFKGYDAQNNPKFEPQYLPFVAWGIMAEKVERAGNGSKIILNDFNISVKNEKINQERWINDVKFILEDFTLKSKPKKTTFVEGSIPTTNY